MTQILSVDVILTTVFPKGCLYSQMVRLAMVEDSYGKRRGSNPGVLIQHPCYGCNLECPVRVVEYQDSAKQFTTIPLPD